MDIVSKPSQTTLYQPIWDNSAAWANLFAYKGKVLHEGQAEMADFPAKDKYACWGRQSGKSLLLGEVEVPRFAIKNDETAQWIFSVTHDQALIIFEYMVRMLINSALEAKVDKIRRGAFPYVTFRNDSVVHARSAGHDGKYARGKTGDRLILDEAAFMSTYAIEDAITPIVAASPFGESIWISTPHGKNHFYKQYMYAKEHGAPDAHGVWNARSFHMPSWANPFLSEAFLRRKKLTTTALTWTTEYGAVFSDNQITQFPHDIIYGCVDRDAVFPIPPIEGHRYVIGYDPADVRDRSAVVVLDTTVLPYAIVKVENIAGRGYVAQKYAMTDISRTYNGAWILMDATKHAPLQEEIAAQGTPVIGIHITNANKVAIIDGLTMGMEQKDIVLPFIEELLSEFEFYEREKMGGTWRLGAPEGEDYYDDFVTATALAWLMGSHEQPEITVESIHYSRR